MQTAEPGEHSRPGPIDPILDSAPCGFLSLDESGTILLVNTTLAGFVGSTREAIEGRPMDSLLSAAGKIFYNTHLFPLLRLHGAAEEVYVPLRGAGGEQVPVLVNGAARQRDGATLYDLVVVPMHQRHELENELIAARQVAEQAASTKDRFLSIVSHELRTPITSVSGYAQLLLREAAGPLTDDQRRYVERMREAARYQVALIEDILDFARQTGQRRHLATRSIPIEEALERVEALLAVRAREDGFRMRRSPRPAEGSLCADPQAVQQILLNLGSNALKFSPPGGEVLITAESDSGWTSIGVVDRGPGIPQDQLERIFEPFVQLEAPVESRAARPGVGLGLAISRELAHAMGGDITVHTVIGQGSTFTLRVPAHC